MYTVDVSRASGELPARLAGDRGDGLFDEYPLLTRGQQATVRGYTIRVVADHAITHAVTHAVEHAVTHAVTHAVEHAVTITE